VTNKAPAYQWYPKDYDTDEAVKLMTYEQEGIYRRLLDHQALHGSIPSDPKAIAKLVPKISLTRFLRLWPSLAGKFPPADLDRRVNQKLERVKADSAAFAEGKARGGRASAQLRLQLYGTAQPQKPPARVGKLVTQNLQKTRDQISDGSEAVDKKSQSTSAPTVCRVAEHVEPASASALVQGTSVRTSAVDRLLPTFKKTHGRIRSPPHGRFR
jgi:hypothetical protein